MQEAEIIVLFVIAVLNAFLALLIISGPKNILAKVYSLFAVLLSFWAIGIAAFLYTPSIEYALIYANFYYIIGTAFVGLFLLFSRIFPTAHNLSPNDYIITVTPVIIISILLWIDKHLLISAISSDAGVKDVLLNTPNYSVFVAFVGVYLTFSFGHLLRGRSESRSVTEHIQFSYILFGTSVAWAFGLIFNILLPGIGNYHYVWLGPVFTIFMVVSIAFAIAKHHLFDAKVIATEILTFILWFGILIRTLTSANSNDWLINTAILVLTTIFGILLVRSVLNEVQSRERIQHLADELAGANRQLQALSRQKTEFLSMASHQFRSPLTAIKGYSSLLLEGSFGPMSEKVRGAVDKVFQSSQLLVSVIDDFLNISRIELGKLKFRFEVADLGTLVRDTIESQRPSIEKTGLEFKMDIPEADYTTTMDSEKIRQVTLNLLDNALKYTEKGMVMVSLQHIGSAVTLAISDTGAGISKENIGTLFEKFNRADAASVKTNGTGLGLYIAKNIIDAHRGKIWAESEGRRKGSTFRVELMAGEQKSLLDQNPSEAG